MSGSEKQQPQQPQQAQTAAEENELVKQTQALKVSSASSSASSSSSSSSSASSSTSALANMLASNGGALPNGLTPQQLYALLQQAAAAKQPASSSSSSTDSKTTATTIAAKDHRFWSTQPVPQFGDALEDQNRAVHLVNPAPSGGVNEPPITEHRPLEVKTVDQVLKTPYPLPAGFEWSNVDVTDTAQVDELYQLLNANYVEDDDSMFRFDYSRAFLQWALLVPHYNPDFFIGVRMASNKKLVAFISGVPQRMRAHNKRMPMVEINFLCVHKKLRSKRMAPVLIKEVTRRVNLTDVWQAAYTAGVHIPRPVAQTRYFHRSLNPKKLIEIGFSRLAPDMTMARTIKKYKLPSEPTTPGFRAMVAADVPQVTNLLTAYLKKFALAPVLTQDEVAHLLIPRIDVVYSYVVVDPGTRTITDMCSFYNLPSTVINHPTHSSLRAAYCYYYATTKTPLPALIHDLLVMAQRERFDVFNALNLLENAQFIEQHLFGPGDGLLHYYLYNWLCPSVPSNQVGLVLL